MDLITLKKKFKRHHNFSKIFNHDKKSKQEFQRLEFLGDRVLALILSHEIYNSFTRFNEGRLATIFSYLTSTTTLSKIAKEVKLDLFIKKKIKYAIFVQNGYAINSTSNSKKMENKMIKKYFSEVIASFRKSAFIFCRVIPTY